MAACVPATATRTGSTSYAVRTARATPSSNANKGKGQCDEAHSHTRLLSSACCPANGWEAADASGDQPPAHPHPQASHKPLGTQPASNTTTMCCSRGVQLCATQSHTALLAETNSPSRQHSRSWIESVCRTSLYYTHCVANNCCTIHPYRAHPHPVPTTSTQESIPCCRQSGRA